MSSDDWKKIPDHILISTIPIIIHLQDVIKVDSVFFRVEGVNIDTKSLDLKVLHSDNQDELGEARISKWYKETQISVFEEDALGRNWFEKLKNQNSSES